jgi:DNA-binding MarR family transcriptional regulator
MPAARTAQTAATDALVSIAPVATRWIERLLARHEPPLTLAQYLALRAIALDGASSSEIARRTGVSGRAVSQLGAALSDAGLIERSIVVGDRRRHALALSPAGRRTFDSAQRLLRAGLSPLLAALPPPEAEALSRLLPVVEAALSSQPPPRRVPRPPPPPHPRQRDR